MGGVSFSNFLGVSLLGIAGVSILAVLLVVVMVVLKGLALWHAAKRDEKWWFIIMLVVNTAGILELVYLVFIVGKWHKAVNAAEVPGKTNPDKKDISPDQVSTEKQS